MKIFTATALLLALNAVALAKPAPDNFQAPQSLILQDWSSPPPGTTFAVVQNTAPTPIPESKRFTTGSPALDNGTTPNIGSPEWKKEQVDNERKEQRLKRIIENICSNCIAKPRPEPERFTTGSAALDNGTTPNIGSPEWKKEQAENERKEQRLKSMINSICRGC